MNKLLTIVIPTYNMQDYLHRCLDSLVLKDGMLMEQLEVLVVNDGSKDNSSAIAHEYETKYPHTFRVIDKENGNYGSCVNRGLKEATGNYIKVLDADDWFDTDEFAKYLMALQTVDVDLVLTNYSIVDAKSMNASVAYRPNLQEEVVYTFKDCNVDKVGIYTMHAVTYRTQMLRDIYYTQTEGISYTDSEWVHLPLYTVQTMAYFDLNVYQYLVGREGQTMDPKVMMRTINHHEIIARSLIENEEKHPSQGFAHLTIDKQIEYMIGKVYRTRLALQEENSFNHEEMAAFDAYIKEHREKWGSCHSKKECLSRMFFIGGYLVIASLLMEYVICIDAYDMEKQKIRISFILPFYGVERYIGKCLESIYSQDVPEEQYEVICVNDCSPDHSEDVVLEFAPKHANLTLIRHEVNKKLGAARNTGLKAAKGKYVWFIDTDDYIQENCLAHVLDLCEKNDLEILHFNIQDNFGNIMRRLVPTDVITGPEEELISEKQQCIEITFPWNRVYKREFLIENGLWFNDLYGGDVIHTILAVNVCQRIMNVDEFFHFYRVDNMSSDTKSAATAQKVYDMSYVLAQAIHEIVPQIKPQWKPEIAECVPWRINTSIRGVMRLPKDEQKKLMSMLRNNPSLFKFIHQHGDYQARLVLSNICVLRMASFVYVNSRNIKRRISSNSKNT